MAASEEVPDNVWFENLKRRNAERPGASTRTPWLLAENNLADCVERQLQADGHRIWGFVIHRTTYSNDADWDEFLQRMQVSMREDFEGFNGLDVLDSFSLTVVEDRATLDGASSRELRDHFKEWKARPWKSEQRRDDDPNAPTTPSLSSRYRFVVQVDAEALHSIVHGAPPPEDFGGHRKGFVKLVNAQWGPNEGNSIQADLGDGRMLSLAMPASADQDVFPEVEGSTDKYLGWMKTPHREAQVDAYDDCRDKNMWARVYRRPPAVVGYPFS